MTLSSLEKEFDEKFVEPVDKEVRALTLNNEPCVIGTAKDVKAFLRQAVETTRQETLEEAARVADAKRECLNLSTSARSCAFEIAAAIEGLDTKGEKCKQVK